MSSSATQSYMANLRPLLTTLFTSLFTVALFMTISNQKELWVLLFVAADVGVLFIRKMVASYLYRRYEENDYDRMVVLQMVDFIHVVIVFIIAEFLLSILTFLTSISTLYWYDYIINLAFVVFFAFVIIGKLG